MVVSGQGQGRIRSQASPHVAWYISGSGIMCQSRSKTDFAGTPYNLLPVSHGFKLKNVKQCPDRPKIELAVEEGYRNFFDKALIPLMFLGELWR